MGVRSFIAIAFFLAVFNAYTLLQNPLRCSDRYYLCLDDTTAALPPQHSFWTTGETLAKQPGVITISTKRVGKKCALTQHPTTLCNEKIPGSHAHELPSSGFLNQIYVKMPGDTKYTLHIEPVDPKGYNALYAAYVRTFLSKMRRLLPAKITGTISEIYGTMQSKENVEKTTEHINQLLEPFGYQWNGTSATEIDAEKAQYARALGIDPAEWVVTDGGYSSFNDFFTHTLTSNARPIMGTRSTDIVSPADSKATFVERVSSELTVFNVKQEDFTLKSFIGDDDLAEEFDQGTLMIFRLSPYNYHRFHFPIDGIPNTLTYIKKSGFESVDPITYKTKIDPLIINKRARVRIETPYGPALMIIVGAFNVGSINPTYQPCEFVYKGDECGFFAYGGSTVTLLFKKNAIRVDQNILQHSQKGFETTIKMGEKIGSFINPMPQEQWDQERVIEQCQLNA